MSALLKRGWIGALTGIVLAACAASSAATGEVAEQKANAGMSAIQDRSSSSPAEALYVEKCSMCHRSFGMGTVLLQRRVAEGQEQLEARNNLSADYIIVAARQGIGNMPRIPRGEVSDEQLRVIARYLSGETE